MQDQPVTPEGQVADAEIGNWVDRYAPKPTRGYLRLSRADRLKPVWLLYIPCIWGVFLAAGASGDFSIHDAWVLFGCGIGAILMRGAGCTWNDITDRSFDAQVARTRSRPLPSGQVTVRGAILWAVAQSLLAFGILLTFYPFAIWLGVASLALVAIYPFAKRFTWWPQIFLGLAFNWGALLGYAAHTNDIGAPAIFLYLSGIVWTLFYDTIYAHQDREDDALIGIKSTARLFGDNTVRWLKYFLAASVLLMALAVILAFSNADQVLSMTIALCGVWAFGWHLAWQIRKLDIDDPEICLRIFRTNRDAGLIPALFLAVALFV